MKKFIKENIFGFVLSAILFGGITTVVATTILSSSVSYTNNSQTTVESALDELYYRGYLLNNGIDPRGFNPDGTGGKISFVYWNENFSNISYVKTAVPTGTGLNGTYDTRAALETAYTDWEDAPMYIKTTKVNGTITGHAACLWYNNREFCMVPNYWDTDEATSKAKLIADMENALGIIITDSNCISNSSRVRCSAGSFGCGVFSDGMVHCYSNDNVYCNANSAGNADCHSQNN